MSRLRTLLSDALALTGVLLVGALAFGVFAGLVGVSAWLVLGGFWFFGVPLLAFDVAAGIVLMDEFA